MNFIQRAWHAIRNQTPFERYVENFLSGGDVSEFTSSEDAILKYSASFGCIRVLSETLASVSPHEFKEDVMGDRERTNDTGLLKLLKFAPNSYMSSYNFWLMAMVQLNIHGNFFCYKDYNRGGQIGALRPILSERVNVVIEKGQIKYKVLDDEGTEKTYTRNEIFHIVGYSQNGVIGLSPLSYFQDIYNLGSTYAKFSKNYYKNGASPTGVFTLPDQRTLKDLAYNRLKNDLRNRYQGVSNAGEPFLLEDGLTFTPISISLVDAQLIENKKFQIEDMARVYRVPLHLIQSLDQATNNNIEHQSLEFSMYTMLPWFKMIELAINTQLLTDSQVESGYYFEFNMNALLRGDIKTRGNYYSKMRQWGVLSVNDIRQLENLNKIDNGDIYLQPMNMVEAGTEPVENKTVKD